MDSCKWIDSSKGRAIKNIINRKFGKLTARYDTGERHSGSVMWNCICECGKEKNVSLHDLVYGYATTCGDIKCRKDYRGWLDRLPKNVAKKEAKLENRIRYSLEILREYKPEWLIENAKVLRQGKKIQAQGDR